MPKGCGGGSDVRMCVCVRPQGHVRQLKVFVFPFSYEFTISPLI